MILGDSARKRTNRSSVQKNRKEPTDLQACGHSAQSSSVPHKHRASVRGERQRERVRGALTLEEAEVAVEGGLEDDVGGGGGHDGGNPRRKVLAGLRLQACSRVLGRDGRRTEEGEDCSRKRGVACLYLCGAKRGNRGGEMKNEFDRFLSLRVSPTAIFWRAICRCDRAVNVYRALLRIFPH
jgi:hypothetical protein